VKVVKMVTGIQKGQETYQYFLWVLWDITLMLTFSLDCTQFQINFQTPGQLPTLPEILRVPEHI